MESFIFILDETKTSQCDDRFESIKKILGEYGSVKPYIEPEPLLFTNKDYQDLLANYETTKEHLKKADGTILFYSPLIGAHETMTEFLNNSITELNERIEPGETALKKLAEFKPVIDVLEAMKNK